MRVVDVTAEFDRFAMATTDMPAEQRIAAFEREIGPIADGFYSRGRRPDDYDLRVLDTLRSYPGRRDGVLAISRDFSRLFASARQKFQSQFGPVSSTHPVYLLDSMGELDGGTRELRSGATLLFGADAILLSRALPCLSRCPRRQLLRHLLFAVGGRPGHLCS